LGKIIPRLTTLSLQMAQSTVAIFVTPYGIVRRGFELSFTPFEYC